MFQIIFKNVEQGDSIILEWSDDEQKKMAVIDCNLLKTNRNPVLEYIKKSDFLQIEFLLLTHPHYDHYSGMRELLEYCEQKGIIIKKFLHTSFQTPSYLKAAVKSVTAQNELIALFKKVRELWKEKNIIEYQSYVTNENNPLELSSDINLKFLAPSTSEFDKYNTQQRVFSDEENPQNNAGANWLSTVIKIYSSSWYLLLTSDCEKSVLKFLGIKKKGEFNSNLLLGQCPHHGAKGSHNGSFWRLRTKETNMPIVFSVGENSYNHPSDEVIDSFIKDNYRIYSTNKVGNLLQYERGKIDYEMSALLDLSSSLIQDNTTSSNLSGDQIFQIDDSKLSYISNNY